MTPEEIMIKVANTHSYETWEELMYDSHGQFQVEYTQEAMEMYAQESQKGTIKTSQEEEEWKLLYELELHESLSTKFGIIIMRVPGGWIYDCWDTEKDSFKLGVFVPYNNEFIAKPKEPFEI